MTPYEQELIFDILAVLDRIVKCLPSNSTYGVRNISRDIDEIRTRLHNLKYLQTANVQMEDENDD